MEQPVFDFAQLISEVGGTVGLFLGFSLVQMIVLTRVVQKSALIFICGRKILVENRNCARNSSPQLKWWAKLWPKIETENFDVTYLIAHVN